MKGVFFIYILISSLWANEDLERLVTLAEDSRDAVVALEAPKEEFILDEESSDFVFSLQEMDKEIANIVPQSLLGFSETNNSGDPALDPCADQYSIDSEIADRIQGRKFQIYFSATFSEGAELGLNPGFAGRNNFNNFMTSASQTGHPNAFNIRTVSALENRYLNTERPTDWDSISLVERAERLQNFATSYSGAEPSLGLILSEYAIRGMTQNPSNWQQELNQIKDHLSFDEKLRVASHFGGRFGDNYNTDRANGTGARAEGIVTIEEMLQSVRDGVPGGVCRDVSQAQSLILQELGVAPDSIYQIGYATSTGGHAVTAVRDPNNPNRIVKINYDYTDETDDRSGGAVLTQNSTLPGFGMNYRIYDANGKPIAKIPTEFGQVLRDATRERSLSDGITRNHNLQRVYVDTPIGVGSLFTGTTMSGDNIVGVAVNKRVEEPQRNTVTEYGVSVVRREGDRASVTVDQTALYSFMKLTYNTPRREVGNFNLGMTGGIDSEVLIMDNTATLSDGRERGGFNIEGTTTLFVGADAKYESEDGRTKASTGIRIEAYPDFQDVQGATSSGYTAALDNLTWSSTVEREITGDMVFTGESAVVLRNIGNTAVFKGTLEDYSRDLAGSITYQTPLSDDVPAFNPLSSETIAIGVQKSWQRPGRRVGSQFELDYSRDLNFDRNSVNATFGIKW
ncbi:MAG: hypothetical protein K9K67_01125 [Bacteriovoracaceae bacterium]|nr:hypothetical protein [Bacteriovoracaceae bacterium]